jgi:hypothetical protein
MSRKSNIHTVNSKHSNYKLPDMVKLQETNVAEYQKAAKEVYEFIGLPGHMPKEIRTIANNHFNKNDIIIAIVTWFEDHWVMESMKLKSTINSEIQVEPLKPTVIPFKFDIQTDYGFKFMEIDGEPSFPYRKRSIEVCIERVKKIECHNEDIIEFENNGEIKKYSKKSLLEMLEVLLVDTETILMDVDKKRIVKIKKNGRNVELTIGELELEIVKNQRHDYSK